MSEKTLPADTPTTATAVSTITEEERQRSLAAFRARIGSRVAGPDSPIYREGLRMVGVRGSTDELET